MVVVALKVLSLKLKMFLQVDNQEVQVSIDVIDKANVEPRYEELMRANNLSDKD